jgi:hypothetical protein
MDNQRVPLYDRLPEIYRIRDQEQDPPGQLQAYLSLVEDAFGEIHKNIESLYHDLFIETCDDWVIPYIGDLLGVTPLKGDAWTRRADLADTIALRRRKGTLASIERLTYNLTQWGVHCVELLENLVWNQHLNHQRPDGGGDPPYGLTREGRPRMTRFTPIRGGTVTLRDPAMLSLLNTPFDPFAHVADVKPPAWGNIRYNLPNLAIFLWRLEDYRVQATQPVWRAPDANPIVEPITGDPILDPDTGEAIYVARFDIHPLGHPLRLFNTYPFDPDHQPPIVTELDETPGPMPMARLTQGSEAGRPEKYLSIDTYEPGDPAIAARALTDVGLQLHLPNLPGLSWPTWTFRGANLCAWENGLPSTVKTGEIVVDPVIGRLLFGVDSPDAADALQAHLLVTYTYGAVGPVGAHPISRDKTPEQWNGETVDKREVNFHENEDGLQDSLDDIHESTAPILIEIQDSMTHTLDLGVISGISNELGVPSLRLNRSLIIRAASNQRPIIQLDQPLRFRPTHVAGTTPEEQNQFNAVMDHLTVRLEGLYITRSATFPDGEPLIARAALNKLEILNCTLDPGGYQHLDGSRAESHPAMQLPEPYGFADFDEENAFDQTPEIVIQHTITGPLRIDRGYTLFLQDSIIDAGEDAATEFAVAGCDEPDPTDAFVGGWGPPTQVNGITVLGRMRVESLHGRGGIWVHSLEVLNNQRGCIKFSYFSGQGDRLPQNPACVKGTDARLRFVSSIFEQPAYGQLAHTTDFRIRERGPRDDAMGAFGFLLEAHKWRNLQIRYREFMPVGIRPLLIPVT